MKKDRVFGVTISVTIVVHAESPKEAAQKGMDLTTGLDGFAHCAHEKSVEPVSGFTFDYTGKKI